MSEKVISIHNHRCTQPCEHKDVCYFLKTKHKDNNSKDIVIDIERTIEQITDKKDVFYSGCSVKHDHLFYKMFIENSEDIKHLTFSSNNYYLMSTAKNGEQLKLFNNNIQMTVYTLEDMLKPDFKTIQKIFLIKNVETFNIAKNIFELPKSYSKIHFVLEQQFVKDNKDLILALVSAWNNCTNKTLSLDSCLQNYVLNGTCAYKDNYIDIRYDGSVRRCPFSDEYHDINYDNPDDMFSIPFKPSCIYHEMFGEKE